MNPDKGSMYLCRIHLELRVLERLKYYPRGSHHRSISRGGKGSYCTVGVKVLGAAHESSEILGSAPTQ